MREQFRKFAPVFGALVVSLALAPVAGAQCGGLVIPHVHPSAGAGQAAMPQLLRAGLLTVGDEDNQEAAIVGFWHVKFVVGSGSSAQTIDAGYSQWHADGTEIMNSGGRAPITSNFCLGVWKQVGYRQYKLNHLAAAWDPTPATTAPERNADGASADPGIRDRGPGGEPLRRDVHHRPVSGEREPGGACSGDHHRDADHSQHAGKQHFLAPCRLLTALARSSRANGARAFLLAGFLWIHDSWL